jgi:hypothetical protein
MKVIIFFKDEEEQVFFVLGELVIWSDLLVYVEFLLEDQIITVNPLAALLPPHLKWRNEEQGILAAILLYDEGTASVPARRSSIGEQVMASLAAEQEEEILASCNGKEWNKIHSGHGEFFFIDSQGDEYFLEI